MVTVRTTAIAVMTLSLLGIAGLAIAKVATGFTLPQVGFMALVTLAALAAVAVDAPSVSAHDPDPTP